MSLSVLSERQDKRMDELNLFIEHYQNTLFQPSEQGASLLITCPTLTALSLAMYSGSCILVAAASMLLHVMQFLPDRVIPNFLKM